RTVDFPRVAPERRQRFLAYSLELTPAPQGHSTLTRRLSKPLWVLFAATALLMSLACLNVAGLFLARGSAREREIITRAALGSSRPGGDGLSGTASSKNNRHGTNRLYADSSHRSSCLHADTRRFVGKRAGF